MQEFENKQKTGDGYETVRVRAALKKRIIKTQNAHYDEHGEKISASDLIERGLDAYSGQSSEEDRTRRDLHAGLDRALNNCKSPAQLMLIQKLIEDMNTATREPVPKGHELKRTPKARTR